MESQFEEISTDFTDDNGVLHIDGFKTNEDEGCIVGYVFNRQVYYTNPEFKYDVLVMATIEILKLDNIID